MENNHPLGCKSDWVEDILQAARGIRRRVLEHTVRSNGGYLSQACSSAEIFAALYLKMMKLTPVPQPLDPGKFMGVPGAGNDGCETGSMFNGGSAPDFDRFILSPAQYALVLYATLVEVGRMSPNGLQQFNCDGGSVEMIGAEHSPGMEVMTGSLGQGLSQAGGIAWARRRKGETGKVWVFMSDGELQSGQNWEAIQACSFHKLDNLRIVVDVNGQQCDGETSTVMNIEPLEERFKAFGAKVRRVNGHDVRALAQVLRLHPDGRPIVILADTDPCRGLELLRGRAPKLHYIRFTSEEERRRFATEEIVT